MRTLMIVLMILSIIDFIITLKWSDGSRKSFNLTWITRIVTLILFLTNY